MSRWNGCRSVFPTCKVIHCMIDSEHFSEKPVEGACRKHCLPETDEVETERYTAECPVPLDGTYHLSCHIFRLKDRDDARLDSVEHSCVYIIWCYCRNMHFALFSLKLDSHRVRPSDGSPFAGTIYRHSRIAEHSSCRGDGAHMAVVPAKHVR